MNIAEYAAKLAAAADRIEAALPREAQIAAGDLLALVEQRVVQRAQRADGGGFSPYSAAHAKKRQARNRNTDKKNFEFFGEMWRTTGVTEVRRLAPGRAAAVIGPQPGINTAKMSGNTAREKTSLLAPNQREIDAVNAALQKRILALIR